METIDRLNALLLAERAGVETLSRLVETASTPELRALFGAVRDDEAWSCAGLAKAIQRLGGAMAAGRGDFAEKVMAEPSLPARLRLLNRGQGWVVNRLAALLEQGLDGETRGFLEEMRTVHVRNIAACDALVARLDARPVLDVRPLPPRERPARIADAFARLDPGQAYVLLDDRDPRPLHDRFAAGRARAFTWQSLGKPAAASP